MHTRFGFPSPLTHKKCTCHLAGASLFIQLTHEHFAKWVADEDVENQGDDTDWEADL